MRFKRVDKSTVRCIVSQDEIEERGLKIEDLIKNGDKAQEFLNEVVDMAEEEIGFKMTSGIQAVQAAFLPNHDVVFTFSDKAENIGMDRALDHLKDMMTEEGWTEAERVDEIRGMTGQNQADAFAKLLREIQDRQEEELQESEAADRKDPSAEDLVEAMGWTLDSHPAKVENVQRSLFLELTEEEQKIVHTLEKQGNLQINTLVVETDIPVHKMSAILFELEMKGAVRVLAGGVYQLL